MPFNAGLDALPASANGTFLPFTVAAPEETLGTLQKLLTLCSLGNTTYENTRMDRSLGIRHDWLSNAVNVWRTDFDWYGLIFSSTSDTHTLLMRKPLFFFRAWD